MKTTIMYRVSRLVLLAYVLVAFFLAATVHAEPFPGERLGHPLRVHVARGLWWQMLRLNEAFGLIGGADVSSSVDVYGHAQGYHGTARAMETFPGTPAALARQDVIILAGSRVAALSAPTQTALAEWVKAGGGLFITGGPLSLDGDAYGPSLAAILPVSLERAVDLAAIPGDTRLRPTPSGGLEGVDWAASPRVYWHHKGVAPSAGSRVMLSAGSRPLLVMKAAGLGKIAVFSATVCGDPAAGEVPFWAWAAWPQVVSAVLRELAPASAVAVPSGAVAIKGKINKAETRLAEIGDDVFGGLLDEDMPGANAGTGKELAELSRLTRTPDFAAKVVRTVANSNTRLSLGESAVIFGAVHAYLAPNLAATLSADLMKSEAPGTVALGLRLAGLGRRHEAGRVMVTFVARGLAALPSDGDSSMVGESLRPPDGLDEGLRLAAAQALSDLGDLQFAPALRLALVQWKRECGRERILADRQRDIEEAIMSSLAVMGEGEAAVWAIDCLIQNSLAKEFAVNASEHRTRNASKEFQREQAKARKNIKLMAFRNNRLRGTLHDVPPVVWGALAAKAKDWDGEFATEAMLLLLAAGNPAPLTPEALTALATIRDETPVPAVQALCRVRLEAAGIGGGAR